MGKVDKLHERTTAPLIGMLSGTQANRFILYYLGFCRFLSSMRGDISLVDFHKKRLGRQDCCFTTHRRYWVWDRDDWRVYVNNHSGVGFEVPIDKTAEDGVLAFQNYRDQLLKGNDEAYTF